MKEMSRREKERLLVLKREQKIRRARISFWEFCKLESPDFYREERWHLKLLAWVLQALYQRKLTKESFYDFCVDYVPDGFRRMFDFERLEEDKIYTRLMMNMPPRHGKSRTLVNFCKWALGKNSENRIITCSYNDDAATDFSRYTRDGIAEDKTYPHQIIYSDIFTNTEIKQGNASYKQWALEGEFFNYKGAGIGGSITGKGCNISIVDDPVKDAEQALNSNALDKIWTWYTGTFLSRLEEGGIEIVNMTRWAKKDVCGRILEGQEANEWFLLDLEVKNKQGNMLCSQLLSAKSYQSKKVNMLPEIFEANYHQQPIDVKGLLMAKEELNWFELEEIKGRNPDAVVNFTDVADEGKDYLSAPVGYLFGDKIFITDVVFTQEPAEVTEAMVASKLTYCDFALFESNNGGKSYARNVARILEENNYNSCVVQWQRTTKNKETRIIMQAGYIKKYFYFRKDYEQGSQYEDFIKQLTSYSKKGKNNHDDANDSITGLAGLVKAKLKQRNGGVKARIV